jgi:hypothetical protein
MRKFLLVVTTILLTVISCGEDREDNTTQQPSLSQKIVGTWTITKKETNGVTIPVSQPCPNHGFFVFSSDKKLSENYKSGTNNSCNTYTDNYNYVIDETAKKVTASNSLGDNMVYTISNLTDSELILVNVEGSDTIKYTFSK